MQWFNESGPPNNSNQGGVYVYYKNSLPFKPLDICYLKDGIVFDLKIGKKIYKFGTLYRWISQLKEDFQTFTNKLELTLDKFWVVALENFNVQPEQ